MRRLALALALALATPAAAQPGGTADPVAFARETYRPATGTPPAQAANDPGGYSHMPIFSPRLRALFAEDERQAGGELGRLAFSPFTGTQDDAISDVRITSDAVEGAVDRRVVTVRFRNLGHAQTIFLYFERSGALWYLDDIASHGFGSGADAQQPWTLSLILKYGR